MNVLIIEDEPLAAAGLRKQIVNIRPDIQVCASLDTIEEAVDWLKNNSAPDLIFMDIQLGDGSSFDIFSKVEVNSPVIFTTAYDEYALKAFKVNSIDYLLKPVVREDLELALEKFEKLEKTKPGERSAGSNNQVISMEALLQNLNLNRAIPQYKGRFLIKIGDKFFSVTKEQIAYFCTEDKAVFVVTHDKQRYPIDQSLDELEKVLDPEYFFRINRQFIAHIDAVTRLHNYFNGKMKVFLKPEVNEEVLVSRDKASVLKSWLDR